MSSMRPNSWVNADSGVVPSLSEQFRNSSPSGHPSSNDDSALGSSCQNLGFVGSNGSSVGSVPQSTHFNPSFGGQSAPAVSCLTSTLETGLAGQALNSQYEKWSSGLELELGLLNGTGGLDLGALTNTNDLDEKLQNVQLYPPRSQVKRQKMICKKDVVEGWNNSWIVDINRFGEFGSFSGFLSSLPPSKQINSRLNGMWPRDKKSLH